MNISRTPAATTSGLRVNVSATGRLSLPIEMRRALGLEKGGTVLLDLQDGAIRLRTTDEAWASASEKARLIFRGKNFSVDDFLAFRKSEWKE